MRVSMICSLCIVALAMTVLAEESESSIREISSIRNKRGAFVNKKASRKFSNFPKIAKSGKASNLNTGATKMKVHKTGYNHKISFSNKFKKDKRRAFKNAMAHKKSRAQNAHVIRRSPFYYGYPGYGYGLGYPYGGYYGGWGGSWGGYPGIYGGIYGGLYNPGFGHGIGYGFGHGY